MAGKHTVVERVKKISRQSKWLIVLLLAGAMGILSGCRTVQFYGQAIKGQCQLVFHERSIDLLRRDAQTPAPLKERLDLLEQMRTFAAKELKLPVDNHYRKYVDVHRPYVVWNVMAAPEFSLEARTWWYPLVGSLDYRGYFSQRGATNYAGYLSKKGYDVSVGGVSAYSTLGWFRDPVLNTFIFDPEAELAETIFHELGHQRLFARGDTDFNEAFATSVGEEGARRWLKARGDTAELEQYQAHLRRNDQFVRLVMATRERLEALYGDTRTEGGRVKASPKHQPLPAPELRRQKQQILEDMRAEYARLKASWGANTEFDAWFAHPPNNTALNSVATYYDLVPGFERLLARNAGNLQTYYAAAKTISKKPKRERRALLESLAKESTSRAQGNSNPGN